MKEAIRLTNKTAIALRKSAQKTRTAYFAAAVMLSITLGAAGSEKKRREQHEQDRMRIKADLNVQMDKAPGKQPFFEKKDEEDDDMLPESVKFEQPEIPTKDSQAQHRRRRQNPLTIIRSEQAK